MRKTIVIVFTTFISFSCIHSNKHKSSNEESSLEEIQTTNDTSVISLTQEQTERYIYSEEKYFNGGITITNSFPKGGAYLDTNGEHHGYGIFFNAIKNDLDSTINLNINFPQLPISINNPSKTIVKLFLPNGIPSSEKYELLDFGVGDLLFLEDITGDLKTSQITINPGQQVFFYVGILFTHPGKGPVRTKLELDNKILNYRISYVSENWSKLIPCGKMSFIKFD